MPFDGHDVKCGWPQSEQLLIVERKHLRYSIGSTARQEGLGAKVGT
jgi:hypothetical protein